ncbi:MAG TPA: hypothetical protein VFV08_08320 [Puia sp.]|nr:hypothetical protein [Puia sp.]
MRIRVALLALGILFSFSCHKNSVSKTAAIEIARGTLIYQDPASDGMGHYFLVDSTNEIILSDNFKEDKYKNLIGIHSLLQMVDSGQEGCPEASMIPGPCTIKFKKVQVVNLTAL